MTQANGVCYGGPAGRQPGSWHWAVYAGPSPAGRLLALDLVNRHALAAWAARRRAHAPHTSWLGVHGAFGYYVLGLDDVGPYVMGYSSSGVARGAPVQTVYRKLARTAHRLIEAAAVDTHAG